MTNLDTVFALIRENPDGLDDDEVSEITGITPRQQVYQLCSKLASQGRIERRSVEKTGKRKKIHNFPSDSTQMIRDIFGTHKRKESESSWERRLAALQAATGMKRDDILDRALGDYAMKVLAREIGEEREGS